MKQLTALTAAWVLLAIAAFAGPLSEVDQKWLKVVETKITSGQTRVSTPVEQRVALLKDWAEKNGYTSVVTQCEHGYRLQLVKNIAQK